MTSQSVAAEDKPLNQLSAREIVDGVARGACSPEAVVASCLERIDAREAELGAWAYLDADHALAQARALEGSTAPGPLFGVPVAIKDIFDTFDMPTGMGSKIYQDYRPASDAAAVAALRAAGAVILGKTVTCEFAGMAPGATVNPHDPNRTPGGSSSGSAAAVADFMAPLALGTQTGGSVLRPSSFCGIVGFKPSFGTINRAGVKMAAEALDTIGIHGRSVDDVELLYDVFTSGVSSQGTTGAARQGTTGEVAPRIGFCRTFLWDSVEAETKDALDGAVVGLTGAGARVSDVDLGQEFSGLGPARDVINCVERARAMGFEWNNHRDEISEKLTATLKKGFETPFTTYIEALELAARLRGNLAQVFGENDVLLVPCVPGVAPEGLSSTGDPALQGLWTILHVPTITLPTHWTTDGLPVGIQLVGRHRDDKLLLDVARWVMSCLRN
ncbi:MAG: amidase [Alphaproteobacteria bacterium]|nr:amidase [Alphaproteobacteria bacterium]